MAIAYTGNTGSDKGTATSRSFTLDSGTNADRMVTVAIAFVNSSDNITACTYDGNAMTAQDVAVDIQSGFKLKMYALTGSDVTSGANTLSVTFSSSQYGSIVGAAYDGVADAAAEDAEARAGGSDGAETVTLTTTSDNCWLFSALGSGGGTLAAGTNTTMRLEDGSEQCGIADSAADQTPAGNHDQNVTASSWNAIVGCAFAPAGAGGATFTPRAIMF